MDVTLVEVGIGGLFDQTNIIPRPVITAVTSLAVDHADLLGNTIAHIARHKGGIFKVGAHPVLKLAQPPE